MTRREGVLLAVSKAASLRAEMPVGTRSGFDIIGAVTKLGIPLMFRPLDRLWGACITVDHQERGIIVTTKLGLSVQRFTIAHELGHVLLGHHSSFDEQIGFAGRKAPRSRPADEVAADTFASELLAPKSLVRASAKRHGWVKEKLCQAEVIYQLALRLGVSYEAACWALATWDVLTQPEAANLRQRPVKELKHALVPESLITNPWADVWALSPADSGTCLEAGPDDLFALHLSDHASAGYVWRLVDLNAEAEIICENQIKFSDSYGDRSERAVYVRFKDSGMHRLVFEHIRPWSRATIETIEIEIEAYGKEGGGWPRRTKSNVREQSL